MRPDELERRLRERLDALGPAPRAELLQRPDAPRLRARRADRLVLGNPATRTFAELLIDCEEDRTLRAVLVWMLRENGELIAEGGAALHSSRSRPGSRWRARQTACLRRVVGP